MTELTALIFEDNQFDQRILAAMLRAFDFVDIINTDDPADAIKIINREDISIAFVDIVMPEANGLEFLKLIRNSSASRNPDLPIVIVSAYSEKKWVMHAIKSGADDYIIKPISPELVYRKVHQILIGNRMAFNRWKTKKVNTPDVDDMIEVE